MAWWLTENVTAFCRRWHHDGLPEELEFGEIDSLRFVRGAMDRAAQLSVGCSMEFGVFGIIGLPYARRASRAWWPWERLLMEDVSCAFRPVSERASAGERVQQIHKDRLTILLNRYLAYVGPAWTDQQIRDAIDQFIVECPRNDPDSDA